MGGASVAVLVGQDDVAHADLPQPVAIGRRRKGVVVQGGVLRPVVLPEPAARDRDAAPGQVVGLPLARRGHGLDPVAGVGVAREELLDGTPEGRLRRPGGVALARDGDNVRHLPGEHHGEQGQHHQARTEAPCGHRQKQQRRGHVHGQPHPVAAERRRNGQHGHGERGVGDEERRHEALAGDAPGEREPRRAAEADGDRLAEPGGVAGAGAREGALLQPRQGDDGADPRRRDQHAPPAPPAGSRGRERDQRDQGEGQRQRAGERGRQQEEERQGHPPALERRQRAQCERGAEQEGQLARQHRRGRERGEGRGGPRRRRAPTRSHDQREGRRGPRRRGGGHRLGGQRRGERREQRRIRDLRVAPAVPEVVPDAQAVLAPDVHLVEVGGEVGAGRPPTRERQRHRARQGAQQRGDARAGGRRPAHALRVGAAPPPLPLPSSPRWPVAASQVTARR